MLERHPRVAVPKRTQQSISLAARHASNVRTAARIRQHEAVTAFIGRTVRTLLGILEFDHTSWVARFGRRTCLLFHRLWV